MHSWPIMVESMSARKLLAPARGGRLHHDVDRRRRRAPGGAVSIALVCRRACARKGNVGGDAGSSQIGACGEGSAPRARSTAPRHRAPAHAGLKISVATKVMAAMTAAGISKRAVLIAGPTASGKSALALALAQELGGTVINADSMQVYRDLRIITARPTPQDEARGAASALRPCRRGRELFGRPLVRDARAALAAVERAGAADPGRRHRALFQGADRGLAAVPPIPADPSRGGARAACGRAGGRALCRAQASAIPRPRSALMPGDRAARRALEVCWRPAGSLTDWHRGGHEARARSGRAVKIFLDVERAELYRRIDARFDAMLAQARSTRSRARRPPPRSRAARHEGARRALADPASRRRDRSRTRGAAEADATPAATPSGRPPGSAISCRIGPGSPPTWRWPRSAARSAVDAPASAARRRGGDRRGRRRAPTRPAAPPCRCRNGRAAPAARRRRW